MRNETCIRFTTILPLILLLTNCSGGGKPTSTTTFVANEAMIATTEIDQDQRNIATRICYAYQSKSNNFHSSEYLNAKYNFSNTQLSCANYSQYNITATLVDNDDLGYTYKTSSANKFNSTVQIDTVGYLSRVCAKIKQNQAISNTVKSGDHYTQITFFNDGSDAYILKYYTLSGTTYVATQSETFKVRTQYNFQNGKILGMDEDYTDAGICVDNPGKTYSFNQKFISKN